MIVFIIGIILFPMPGSFGIPTMVFGLSIMLEASSRVKRLTVRLVHKNRHSSYFWRKIRDLHKRIRNP